MNFRASDFRKKLNATHNIDHVVELQIIVAILLENGISDISPYVDFTNCFNQEWNLQIITKQQNRDKGKIVLKYIRWKFDTTKKKQVNKEEFSEILRISLIYKDNRTIIINHLKTFLKQSKEYLNLEESLFYFLTDQNKRHHQISIDKVINESKILKKEISQSNNIDHIVELQILTFILSAKNIESETLALIFIKCFHKSWNFQIMTKTDNINKGKMVTKWIKRVEENLPSEKNLVMKSIFDHYKNNINVVKKYIETDNNINREEKNQLLNVADYLLELFKNNIL